MKTISASLSIRVVSAAFALGWSVVASAVAADPAGVQPDLSISLRGISLGSIEVGEPFRVAVRVDVPHEATTKLQLSPAQGSWISATTLEIISTSGNVIPASARLAAPLNAQGATIIDAENPATALWWFPAESLNGIVPGDYSVRARLVIRDGTGWKGELTSEPAPLRVVATSTDAARGTQRKLSLARAAILANEPAKAGEILYALLEVDPDNIPALALQAGLCLEGGNRGGARICIERALVVSAKLGGEPSAELHQLADRIELSKSERVQGSEVPTWTRVPRSVFEPVRTETAGPSGPVDQSRVDPKPAAASSASAVATAAPASMAAPAISAPPAAQASTTKSEGVLVNSAELSDAKIVSDPAGQWAATAKAGSQYGKTQYSATQATGAPNVPVAGNSPDAWCPAVRDKGMDWLELTFAKPIQATEVRVRQNDASGAIAKIEAIESNGTVHVWWEGADPFKAAGVREIVWFAVRVPKTSYPVARVKITLNLASGPGYKEIDAVQLVGVAP